MPERTTNHKPLATSFMLHALRLGARNLGLTAPNPAVGCVIVKNNEVVGRGWTAVGGRPHAETIALQQAGETARGATAYVTLEPCCHHGKTPPCTDALIAAGVAEVVIAVRDPNPKVAGKGVAALEAAGIRVTENICRAEAEYQHAGFFKTVREGLPLVTLKLALTADGKLATEQAGRFTSPEALAYAHLLRYRHDAILVGSSTVLADDPHLTCRLAGMEHGSPQRFVLDRRGRIPATAKCQPCTVLDAPVLQDNLHRMVEAGITRVLAEGGAETALALLQDKLVDRLVLIEAPGVTGAGDAEDMRRRLEQYLPQFTPTQERALGGNRLRCFSL